MRQRPGSLEICQCRIVLELKNAHKSYHETTKADVSASLDGFFQSMVPIGSFTPSFDV